MDDDDRWSRADAEHLAAPTTVVEHKPFETRQRILGHPAPFPCFRTKLEHRAEKWMLVFSGNALGD
jgi:hypothetical protein